MEIIKDIVASAGYHSRKVEAVACAAVWAAVIVLAVNGVHV